MELVYRLMGNYGYGWEEIEERCSRREVLELERCYRENAPNNHYKVTGPHKVEE